MSEETVVTVVTPTEPVAEVVAEETSVIEQAIELAEIIDEARQEGAETAEIIEVTLAMLRADIAELKGLVEYCLDELVTLKAVEVAEILVEETPAEVEEVAAVAEEIIPEEEVVIAPEEVVEINEPAPRIQKRKRNFI